MGVSRVQIPVPLPDQLPDSGRRMKSPFKFWISNHTKPSTSNVKRRTKLQRLPARFQQNRQFRAGRTKQPFLILVDFRFILHAWECSLLSTTSTVGRHGELVRFFQNSDSGCVSCNRILLVACWTRYLRGSQMQCPAWVGGTGSSNGKTTFAVSPHGRCGCLFPMLVVDACCVLRVASQNEPNRHENARHIAG